MDLSKLLGDLYETDEVEAPVDAPLAETAPAPPDTRPAAGPDWADEALLDEAFASWTPGPPDSAPAAEREMANGFPATSYPELEGDLSGEGHPDDDHGLHDTVMGGDRSMTDGGVPESVQTDVDAGGPVDTGLPRMWTRADDDVLPHRRGRRRGLKFSLRRR